MEKSDHNHGPTPEWRALDIIDRWKAGPWPDQSLGIWARFMLKDAIAEIETWRDLARREFGTTGCRLF